MEQASVTKRQPAPLNGVDTPTLFAAINAVREQPELARFTFRASNRWLSGTHSQNRTEAFDGAGGTHRHAREMTFDADHPPVLVGGDQGPAPVEYLLDDLTLRRPWRHHRPPEPGLTTADRRFHPSVTRVT